MSVCLRNLDELVYDRPTASRPRSHVFVSNGEGVCPCPVKGTNWIIIVGRIKRKDVTAAIENNVVGKNNNIVVIPHFVFAGAKSQNSGLFIDSGIDSSGSDNKSHGGWFRWLVEAKNDLFGHVNGGSVVRTHR